MVKRFTLDKNDQKIVSDLLRKTGQDQISSKREQKELWCDTCRKANEWSKSYSEDAGVS
jgi:hypothetical protein